MRPRLVFALVTVATCLSACTSYQPPPLLPDPVMANPPPRPPGFENKGWGGSSLPAELGTGSIAGVPTTSTYIVDTRAGIVLPGAVHTVPGVNNPYPAIRDQPVRRRDEVVSEIDSSLRLLNGAASVTRMSLPTPGLEAAHAAAVQRFDNAMREVEQRREAMRITTDPGLWEQNKDRFNEAWQAAETAYAQAKALGN